MFKKTVILLIALVAIAQGQGWGFPISMVPHIGKLKETPAPKYRLDLQVEPRHRWDHIAPDFKAPIQKFTKAILDALPITKTFWVTFGLFVESQTKYKDFTEEVKGIADIVEVDWQKLMLANFMYDISSVLPHPSVAKFCTSIVTKNKQGRILHGRNLDFWPWALFSKDSALIEVYNGDKKIAEFDQVIGSVFVLSGMKMKSFSITVDTRKMDHDMTKDNLADLIDNIVVKKYVPSCFLTRLLLQDETMDYAGAFDALQNTNVTAPIYYTIAGLTEGAVIEKQAVGTHGVYQIGPDTKEWYLVVTNYDVNQNPGQDDRKSPACKRLDSIGQEDINITNLYSDVMMQYPNLNIASIMTTMFEPSVNYNQCTLWYGSIDDFESQNFRGAGQTLDKNFHIEDPYVRELNFQGWPSADEVESMAEQALIGLAKDLIE